MNEGDWGYPYVAVDQPSFVKHVQNDRYGDLFYDANPGET
jgi:hypothetical protein